MNPFIRLGLTHTEEKPLNRLGGIEPEIHQDKQQLIFQFPQLCFATRSHRPFTPLPLEGLLNKGVPGRRKAGQQRLKLLTLQSRQTA